MHFHNRVVLWRCWCHKWHPWASFTASFFRFLPLLRFPLFVLLLMFGGLNGLLTVFYVFMIAIFVMQFIFYSLRMHAFTHTFRCVRKNFFASQSFVRNQGHAAQCSMQIPATLSFIRFSVLWPAINFLLSRQNGFLFVCVFIEFHFSCSVRWALF